MGFIASIGVIISPFIFYDDYSDKPFTIGPTGRGPYFGMPIPSVLDLLLFARLHDLDFMTFSPTDLASRNALFVRPPLYRRTHGIIAGGPTFRQLCNMADKRC